MSNNKICEYNNLRNEINQKIELHNNLLTFTITTTVAVMTFALSQNSTILYLVPFCILIPMSMIAYYRSAMSKLSAYMIVFLEKDLDGINWETRNAALVEQHLNKKKKDINKFTVLRYFECLILTVICYSFYVIDYVKDKEFNAIVVINILWPLSFVIWEILITKHINSIDKEKKEWIKRWNKLKNLYEE